MTIRFNGRTRADAKRRALAYWVANQERLQMTFKDFLSACTMTPDGTTIVFARAVQQPRRERKARPRWLLSFAG